MKAFASMVIFDRRDIRLSVATTEDRLRADLVEFYNDSCDDDDQHIDPDTPLEEVKGAIEEQLGHAVIIEETWVEGLGS
jgi:hypothetical protein